MRNKRTDSGLGFFFKMFSLDIMGFRLFNFCFIKEKINTIFVVLTFSLFSWILNQFGIARKIFYLLVFSAKLVLYVSV